MKTTLKVSTTTTTTKGLEMLVPYRFLLSTFGTSGWCWLLLLAGVRKLFPAGLHAPDFSAVLGDGSVGAELAGGGHVHDGHLGPQVLVL